MDYRVLPRVNPSSAPKALRLQSCEDSRLFVDDREIGPHIKFCGLNLFRKGSLSSFKKGKLVVSCYRNKKFKRFVLEDPITHNLRSHTRISIINNFITALKKCQLGFISCRALQLLHPMNDRWYCMKSAPVFHLTRCSEWYQSQKSRVDSHSRLSQKQKENLQARRKYLQTMQPIRA